MGSQFWSPFWPIHSIGSETRQLYPFPKFMKVGRVLPKESLLYSSSPNPLAPKSLGMIIGFKSCSPKDQARRFPPKDPLQPAQGDTGQVQHSASKAQHNSGNASRKGRSGKDYSFCNAHLFKDVKCQPLTQKWMCTRDTRFFKTIPTSLDWLESNHLS